MDKKELIEKHKKADMNLRTAYAMLGGPNFGLVRAEIGQALSYMEQFGLYLEQSETNECEYLFEKDCGIDGSGFNNIAYKCSNCGNIKFNSFKHYCENCGAKIKKE